MEQTHNTFFGLTNAINKCVCASGSVSRPIGKIMTYLQTDIMVQREVRLPIIEKNLLRKVADHPE